MNEKNKISIIVCVYNTEKYIEKCIRSILSQTYKNIEIMIVNDCSKDNSLSIINKLAKEDKRIVVIDNKENKGLSYSRNIGFKKSTGEYIGYIDSDDYIQEDYYEKMINRMIKEKSDVCVCDINLVYEDTKNEQRSKCGGPEKIDFINCGLAASACNKLFKRELIEINEFSVGKVNEDLAVILPILINSKKISYEESVVYNYVQRNNSIQNSKITNKRFDIFYGVDLTLDRIKECDEYNKYKDGIVFQQLISLLLYVLTNEKNFFKRIKWFRKYSSMIKKYNIRSNIYYLEFLDNVGRKHSIYYKLLVNSIIKGFNVFASILVSLFNLLKKVLTKNVIKKNITIDNLEKFAKKQSIKQKSIKLSVIIPNYNYEKYLLERLYSILVQKEKIYEIIILDDCSKDNSRKLIEEICNRLDKYIDIKYIFNETNSGTAFKQWEKGFDNATGDYIWICEADDYCDKKFLENVLKPIKNDNNIVLSYTDTAFIDSTGDIIIKSIVPEIDIMKTNHWNSDFINDGKKEVEDYSFLNCTIANVSSCIIKKGDYKDIFKLSRQYKQAGDWVFYNAVMQYGKIAYTNKNLNYYRLHGNNVSSVIKKEAHIEEIKSIYDYEIKNYKLNKNAKDKMNERIEFLKKVWKLK